jgi:peptide subunit release factor 1 (eRF1)
VPVITEAAIKVLAGFRSEDAPVVSCYLDVDGRRQVRPQDIERRLAALVREASSGPSGAEAAGDLAKITEHVGSGLDRSGVRGLALFSCASKGLWEVVELPVPVANRIVVNQSPAVGTLESIVQELEPLGVLLVDRQRARMFVFQFGELVDRTELFEALPRDYDQTDDAGRGGADKLQGHTDELATQHLRHAAEVAFRLHQDNGFGRLTIGATDEVAAAIEPLLHPYLRERLSPRIGVGAGASEAEVKAAAMVVEQEVERAKEAAVVAKLRDSVGAGSKAVAGLAATLGALNERRVGTLVVSDGYAESGWRCACGALAAKGPQCPNDGGEMTHLEDVIHDAVDVALTQGCHVEVCVGNADLDVLGRIGALLRY